MALQSIAGSKGLILASVSPMGEGTSITNNICNANGESAFIVGRLTIVGGGSKTISATGGGSIWWRPQTVTFVNGSTILRVGLQDVDASGLNDDTFDVYCEHTTATTVPTSNVVHQSVMTSGTKTVTDGDLIAIGVEMPVRGGTDSVSVRTAATQSGMYNTSSPLFPYRVIDIGSGPKKQTSAGGSMFVIEFDDGSLGYVGEFSGVYPGANTTTSNTFHVNSATDEYANLFKLPFKCGISGIVAHVTGVSSPDDFEIVLYSDAKGTPAVELTISVDADYVGTQNGQYHISFPEVTLLPGVWYAVAIRPTTTNAVSFSYNNMGDEKYKTLFPFGRDFQVGTRSNQSGAFSVSNTAFFGYLTLLVTSLDDGVSSGGGEVSHVF